MKIVEYRKIWFGISSVIIILGLVFFLMNGLNLGIDFAGGTIITIDLHQTFEVSDIEEISKTFDPGADITFAGEDRQQVVIQTKVNISDEQRQEILKSFQSKYNIQEKDILSVDKVDPVIGKELTNQVLVALAIAVVGMLIYITLRFELSFALAAIIALIHDALIVLAFYSLMRIQVNTPFIAAILTVLGYSINDTIVIFDRIRENRRVIKRNDYTKLINTSISQTLSRSINTSLTTLITITALYIFGVEAIRSFALPIIVGFMAGTFSSIFIASPIWYVIKTRGEKNPKIV
ncbi:protein translocase subunit SecF [Irregularibacter muris]|uniref:Protein-export membrane protein SecF n=1 Tax=Irregularibacter muris TaxID=1796619 RepID=A0AAE3HGK2_9FIRM|nr:protein translocase subunit SecF [Irregularibacter muris]MCR1898208.1 protein translocase subunit SecF [Irregularibacter muris]